MQKQDNKRQAQIFVNALKQIINEYPEEERAEIESILSFQIDGESDGLYTSLSHPIPIKFPDRLFNGEEKVNTVANEIKTVLQIYGKRMLHIVTQLQKIKIEEPKPKAPLTEEEEQAVKVKKVVDHNKRATKKVVKKNDSKPNPTHGPK